MLTETDAYRRIQAAGMRLTLQRRAVITVLVGNPHHPTVEDIAGDVRSIAPGVSLSTVYKILNEFAELGLVREVSLPGAVRFDPNTDEHMHLVCEGCGGITDIEIPPGLRETIERSGITDPERIDVLVRTTCVTCGVSPMSVSA